MSSKRRKRNLHSFCKKVRSGDGLDPRFDNPAGGHRVGNRKALQLCSQIERELNGILADSADETLRSLMVIGVRPAPSSMRVLVEVTP